MFLLIFVGFCFADFRYWWIFQGLLACGIWYFFSRHRVFLALLALVVFGSKINSFSGFFLRGFRVTLLP